MGRLFIFFLCIYFLPASIEVPHEGDGQSVVSLYLDEHAQGSKTG
jgi:hypothetical protein